MRYIGRLALVLILLFCNVLHSLGEKDRESIISEEKAQAVGGKLKLSPQEETVNEYLMNEKNKDLSPLGSSPYASMHFMDVVENITQSAVYKLIKRLPKGAALHLHYSATGDVDWLVKNLTYWDNLYFRTVPEQFGVDIEFKFADPAPEGFEDINEHRAGLSADEIEAFDSRIRKAILLDPSVTNPDDIWDYFESRFDVVKQLIRYEKAIYSYIERCLQSFYDDNVMYIEFRGGIRSLGSKIYTLDGSKPHDADWAMEMFQNVSKKFMETHPNSLGLRLVHTTYRGFAPSESCEDAITRVKRELNVAKDLMARYPGQVLGFDVVGREDTGQTLKCFKDLFTSDEFKSVNYFFHAGETNHYGTAVDENILDAIKIGAKRLGHALAIVKHPEYMDLLKKEDVGIELCPISNQVLLYVKDLRNHPGAIMYANNLPMVITADDPTLWAAVGLSHDFYVAFTGYTGHTSDLRFIKQMAINSFKYSGLSSSEKVHALYNWNCMWETTIENIANEIKDKVSKSG